MELLVSFNTQSESQTAGHLSAPSVAAKPIATGPFLPVAGLFPVCKGCWLTKYHRLIEGLINTPEVFGRWRRQGQVNEFWKQSHFNMAEVSTQCRHSSECYVCRNPINVGCPYVHLDERPIHAHCLICAVCGVRLTDKEFVAHHGQYVCQNHAFSELSH
ncbi:hypothetical protein CSKR_108656 [Clonorchis sinensis]|uniref:LIM zinc-binding domain-containing protein n=1 Tax=Clonorchis sinensis TaxID=79923 RepID=A0A8T1MMU7_CLOSI|nr:hypothetical protein CSKR_108656 [Clonorchis sinensis]